MYRITDVLWTGIKSTGIAMTLGGYHLYAMNERWKLQQEIRNLQNEEAKAMLEAMKELSKRT
jgi:hypothetical protein